jgi:hypothetical protein
MTPAHHYCARSVDPRFEQHVPQEPHDRLAKRPHNSDVTHAHFSGFELPDEQQCKLTVVERGSSTSTAAGPKADNCRAEIWSARSPLLDMTESIAGPIRRDLHVPTVSPRAGVAAAYASACDCIGAGRGFGDVDPCSPVLRVKRKAGVRHVSRVDCGRRIIGPGVTQHSRRPSRISGRRRSPRDASKNQHAKYSLHDVLLSFVQTSLTPTASTWTGITLD